MINHIKLGRTAFGRSRKLKELIDKSEILFAGNKKLKIYGTLNCPSGKRMKAENRVFFQSQKEAEGLDFRPCGHCMREAYLHWKVLR